MTDLSICVTFCNQDKYIKPLTERLIKLSEQSRYRWEILIGVDHPSDRTNEIIDELKKSIAQKSENIKIHKINTDMNLIPLSRASMNRLHLLRNATSPYVMLLDGDDEYTDIVDDGIEFLSKNLNFVGVAFKYFEFYESRQVYQKVRSPYPDKTVVNYLDHCAGRNYFSSNCMVFRREAAVKNFLDEGLYCNDTFLTRLLLKLGPVYYIDREIMLYRKEIPSIYSGSSRATKIMSELIIQEELLRKFPEIKSITEENLRRIIKRAFSEKGLLMDLSYGVQARERNLPLSMLAFKMFRQNNYCVRKFMKFKLALARNKLLR